MSTPTPRRVVTAGPSGNVPLYSLGCVLVFVLVIGALALTGHDTSNGATFLIGLAASTIPSLVAAAFSERTSRDVRNGVMVEKARQGADAAIRDAVPDVLTAHGVTTQESQAPAVTAAMQALTALLHTIHDLPTTTPYTTAPTPPEEAKP